MLLEVVEAQLNIVCMQRGEAGFASCRGDPGDFKHSAEQLAQKGVLLAAYDWWQ